MHVATFSLQSPSSEQWKACGHWVVDYLAEGVTLVVTKARRKAASRLPWSMALRSHSTSFGHGAKRGNCTP